MNSNQRHHNKKIVFVIMLIVQLLAPLAMSGCWDKTELEEYAFAQVIGVDHTPRGVVLTIMFAIPRNLAAGGGGGGGGGGGETFLVTSVESPSVLAALDLINGYLDRRVNLMHTKAIIIGEEEARTGVAASLGALMRYREIRRTINIAVTRGKAAELIKSYKSSIESNSARWFEEMGMLHEYTGLTPSAMYHQFLLGMENPAFEPVAILAALKGKGEKTKPGERRDEFLGRSLTEADFYAGSIPRTGGGTVEFFGTAVFRGDRMVTALTGSETRMFLMLNGQFRRAFIDVEDPQQKNYFIPIDVKQGNMPDIKVDLSGDKPRITVKLKLEGDILSIQSRLNYTEDKNLRMKLNRRVEEVIEKGALATIHRTQKQKADIIGFGKKAQHYFATWDEWVKYRWSEKYPEAVVDVVVDFNIRRVGMQFAQPEVTQ